MVQDTSQIKDKILSVIRIRGPSLPVHISKEIGSSILFSSAFLSELVSDKRIKVSHMRVGSSPIYFLPGQEHSLERFSQYLKSREKDAFQLLREKKFLKDREQSPAIQVAMREIRDFAVPFNSGEEVVWRYYLVPESEFKTKEEAKTVKEKEEKIEERSVLEEEPKIQEEKEEKKQGEAEKEEENEKQETAKKRTRKIGKKKSQKKDETFFTSIKEFMSSRSIELIDIENFGAKEIILRVRQQGEELLLIAYNKNKIDEPDIIKASKKAAEKGLKYMVISKGKPLKKLENLLSAVKDLSAIDKV